MNDDPKALVSQGYDTIAADYLAWSEGSRVRLLWLGTLLDHLRPGSLILDLGCGAGVPVARTLVDAGMRVLGVDGSARQIALARQTVPEANFTCADMTSVQSILAPASFDAVAAFYSITHVPRDEHAVLLKRIAERLRPDGIFVASLGATDSGDWRGAWLGTEMYFSHFDADTNLRLLGEAGLVIERACVMKQDDEDARFLWVLARRPAS